MTSVLLAGLLLATFAVGVVSTLAVDVVLSRRALNRSLRTVTWDDPEIAQVRERELAIPATQRILVPALRRIGLLARRLAPVSVIHRLDHELVYAGARSTWSGERVLALKVALAPLLSLSTMVVSVFIRLDLGYATMATLTAGVVGYYGPEWVLRSRAADRQSKIQRALPDALDLLSITVEAGLGFDAALDRVAREIRGPLGGELYRVVQEMRLGRARADALRDLGERSSVDELGSFVMAMIQADIFGISVASVLHIQADELRIKRRQRAEEEAMKLPVKILFPLIFGIFPALFVILLGPAALSIYDNVIQS